ncbi:MAG: PTS sugar transporter subunit IIA [Bacillota bacterium]|jgi:mannitol/fructose-specific phosphotransferase system IIA component (Ntr-type)
MIDEKTILLKIDLQTPEEVIRAAGRALFEGGYVQERYIDSMVNNYLKNGPYFVLAPGLALPHGRPEDGALKTGMSVVTLKEAVEFGNAANDPVRVVLGIAAMDNDDHILLMSKLAKVLNEKDIVSRIAETDDKQDILALIQIKEQEMSG